MTNPLYQRHIISVSELSETDINLVLATAKKLKEKTDNTLLKGKLVATCFFEPSTRTRLSFETAIQRLGGQVIGFSDGANTSAKKGESLSDSARIISSYADAIVIRHHKEGAARITSQFSRSPVINGGDGSNQHPTQTLLDLFSIQETQGTLSGLKVALAGDLKYGRTVHSLAQALSRYNCEFLFVAPKQLAMPDYICEELDEKGCRYTVVDSLEEAASEVDVLYMTRVQRERFDEEEFKKIQGNFILSAAQLEKAKSNMRILHPLPRVDEITADVDDTPFAYYFEQAENGVYVRQALLALILNESL